MRYDDAHGRFHRHAPGWPEPAGPIEAFLDDIPLRRRAAVAEKEIRGRHTAWEDEVFSQEGGDRHDSDDDAHGNPHAPGRLGG